MSNRNDRGLFDEQFRLERLAGKADPLAKLDKVIPWEDFRPMIEQAFPVTNPVQGGRPPFDRLMMFKVMVLQSLYNISDASAEFQILDRLTFMKFLGLRLSDRVPDEKTIWLFREQLKKQKLFDDLFDFFNSRLAEAGIIVEEGRIVDATIVEVPRQHNTREQNRQVKDGHVPLEWKENKPKLRQKDMDASWLKKNGETYYGYKDHVKVGEKSKLILEFQVTPAHVHDSEVLGELLDESDRGQCLHADSAYAGGKCESIVEGIGMINEVHEKGYRDHPLDERQKSSNNKKSRVRARVEHVFGFMHVNMNKAIGLRYIGLDRNASAICMQNLVYNMCRVGFLLQWERCAWE